MLRKFVGAELSGTKFFKISHFLAFFDVLAQISAPVARHSWRLWQMKAGAWSFHLPKSRPRASHWHLQITKTRMGSCFLAFLGHFSVFFLGLPWFSGAGKCKLVPGASICQSLGSAEAAGAKI